MRRAEFRSDECRVVVHVIGPTLISSGEIEQLLLRVRQMTFAGDLANPHRQITIMLALLPPNPIAGHPESVWQVG
jgi:hypothetical protein